MNVDPLAREVPRRPRCSWCKRTFQGMVHQIFTWFITKKWAKEAAISFSFHLAL